MGALDGMHLLIRALAHWEVQFINRKGFHRILFQVAGSSTSLWDTVASAKMPMSSGTYISVL